MGEEELLKIQDQFERQVDEMSVIRAEILEYRKRISDIINQHQDVQSEKDNQLDTELRSHEPWHMKGGSAKDLDIPSVTDLGHLSFTSVSLTVGVALLSYYFGKYQGL